jgi:hypothetical protein
MLSGIALGTLDVNPTEVQGTVPGAQLANPGSFSVTVTTPAPGGGTSNAVALDVSLAVGAVASTANPQVALYSILLPSGASASIEFGLDTTYGLNTWTQDAPAGGGPVHILVAGMLANSAYHLRADVSLADGSQLVDTDHTFTTGAPPAASPITATNPNGLTPSPGVTLYELTQGASGQVELAAADNAGNLVWYYKYPVALGVPNPAKLLSNGHMLLTLGGGTNPGTVQEIDLAGDLISQFRAADLTNWLNAAGYNVTVYQIHHDLLPLPNGHLIVLFNHYENFTDLPGFPGTTAVLGDGLVDLDQNHNVVWEWDSFNYLDVSREGISFPDWTHSNCILYSPDDGNLILSMRNQSWILKIDYQNGQGTGDIIWHFGYQGDFTLTNGQNPDWMYAQHYPTLVSPNSTGVFNLEVFDDGNDRVMDAAGDICGTSGQPACYSRVPIYQLDETAMTATILWVDNVSPVFTPWGGSAQQLENDDVVFDITAPSDDPTGTRYLEVTNASPPEVVLQLELSGQNAYRAVHMPSLYPGVQW